MKNIALTGFMGTGKSAVGRYLAKRLGYSYIDVDHEIERSKGMRITDIFKTYGEEAFRDMESETIAKVVRHTNAVISTGGGAVMRQENLDRLRERCIIVCLKASPETILSRVKNNKDRPLLDTADPMTRIKELLRQREPYYQRADITIQTDGLSPSEVVEHILSSIDNWR